MARRSWHARILLWLSAAWVLGAIEGAARVYKRNNMVTENAFRRTLFFPNPSGVIRVPFLSQFMIRLHFSK